MPIELAQAPDRFEQLMNELAQILVTTTANIEAQFINVAAHPKIVEAIILDEWTGNLQTRASNIRRIQNQQDGI